MRRNCKQQPAVCDVTTAQCNTHPMHRYISLVLIHTSGSACDAHTACAHIHGLASIFQAQKQC